MTTDADRILSTGMPITGAGGEERRLRFSLLALKRCEDAYGSLGGTLAELRWLTEQVVEQFPEPVAGRTAAMLGHVLGEEPVDAVATPAECIEALSDAWLEAFPQPGEVQPGKP